MVVFALAEQVEVEIGDHWQEGVGVHRLAFVPVGVFPAHHGVGGEPPFRAFPLEQPGLVHAGERFVRLHRPRPPGPGQEHPPHHPPRPCGVAPEEGEGVVVTGLQEAGKVR